MAQTADRTLPAALIAEEALLLQHLSPRPEGRDASIAAEVQQLNDAVLAAAAELTFDDQPTDFLARLVALRDGGNEPS